MITEKEKNTMIKHIRECKEIEGIFLATPRGSIWVGDKIQKYMEILFPNSVEVWFGSH